MLKEWESEPTSMAFKDPRTGFECHIKRNGSLALCGYVSIPMDAITTRLSDAIEEYDLNVHGGITYTEESHEDLVIGFDCAHYRDLVPKLWEMEPKPFNAEVYRNILYVVRELRDLNKELLEYL